MKQQAGLKQKLQRRTLDLFLTLETLSTQVLPPGSGNHTIKIDRNYVPSKTLDKLPTFWRAPGDLVGFRDFGKNPQDRGKNNTRLNCE